MQNIMQNLQITKKKKEKKIFIRLFCKINKHHFLIGWEQFGNHIYHLFADQKTWMDARVCV